MMEPLAKRGAGAATGAVDDPHDRLGRRARGWGIRLVGSSALLALAGSFFIDAPLLQVILLFVFALLTLCTVVMTWRHFRRSWGEARRAPDQPNAH
jgi:hypothetical protein